MKKFKVGDKVKILELGSFFHKIGTVKKVYLASQKGDMDIYRLSVMLDGKEKNPMYLLEELRSAKKKIG